LANRNEGTGRAEALPTRPAIDQDAPRVLQTKKAAMRLECLPSLIQVAKPVSLLSQRRAKYWPGYDMASRTQQQGVGRSPVDSPDCGPEIKEPSTYGAATVLA
jgi:hypothetical protein